MQDQVVDFGKTDLNKYQTDGGKSTADSSGKQDSSQQPPDQHPLQLVRKSGGLISVAGCAGAGSSGGGFAKIINIVAI